MKRVMQAFRFIVRNLAIAFAVAGIAWGTGYWFGKGWSYAQPDVTLHVHYEDETDATP